MRRRKHYGHVQGDSAYYPFGLRTSLRKRQQRSVLALRFLGVLALVLAAALALRQTVGNGGQPAPPRTALLAATPESAASPASAPVSVTIRPATVEVQRDVLNVTQEIDSAAHASPAPQAAGEAGDAVLPQYRELYEQNPDLIGWLSIEGTKIDYPVVQTPGDNEYYLRRGFDRLYATSGTLFLDERCAVAPHPTANWLIYGHNMANGSMFGQLTRYADADFYNKHPTFRFDTLYQTGTWQVVAALRTTLGADELPYYTFFDAPGRAQWQQYLDAITALALYDTGVTPQYGDQLLTLSTCGTTRSDTDQRFAVLAVRVAD